MTPLQSDNDKKGDPLPQPPYHKICNRLTSDIIQLLMRLCFANTSPLATQQRNDCTFGRDLPFQI